MLPFTFVHAADLHLDAPFRGLSRSFAGGPGEKFLPLMRNACFIALERLTDLCIQEKADFLLLAGDVLNAADGSLRARLALRDAVNRLYGAGIQTFMVHGNHDPAGESVLPPMPGLNIFPTEPAVLEAARNGEVLALIHGVSHAGPHEGRNLAQKIRRTEGARRGLFQIGLLHCALSGQPGHASYAPCTAGDLAAAGMDYWALGHIHTPLTQGLGEDKNRPPYLVYPGSIQGLHVNETGPRGCRVVRVSAEGKSIIVPVALAPVEWAQLTLDLYKEDPADITALEECIVTRLGALRAEEQEGHAPDVRFVRVVLEGKTPLHHALMRAGVSEELGECLNRALEGADLWVRDLSVRTKPPLDLEGMADRPDLAGELYRRSRNITADEASLAAFGAEHLGPLFNRPGLGREAQAPTSEELAVLMEEASLLALDLLEGE